MSMPALKASLDEHALVNRMVDGMTANEVKAWLEARLKNCARISAEKTGEDKRGWLEDAAYFTATLALIDWTEANKLEVN